MQQERWFLTLGFLPMLVGAVALVLLRRPTESYANTTAGASGQKPRAGETSAAATGAGQHYLGVIAAEHTADLGAELGGSVVKVFVREGARVKAGDPLLHIDPAAASGDARMAQAELVQQRSVVLRAQAEYEEAQDLLERLTVAGSGVSAQMLVAAKSRAASARAAYEEAQAGIDVGKARIERERWRVSKHLITAPFDGVVVAFRVDPGDVVLPGQMLARVIGGDTYVRFAVPPSDTSTISEGAPLEVREPASKLSAAAVVTDLLPEVDAASGLVFVRARLASAGEPAKSPVPGTRVEVRLAKPAKGGTP
jgi:RND family efflux transporter MFP subunit